jgi:hypothetical protein
MKITENAMQAIAEALKKREPKASVKNIKHGSNKKPAQEKVEAN